MVKLIFPQNDARSDGKSFNPKRPWLKQGAVGVIITEPVLLTCRDAVFNGRFYTPKNVTAVRFKDSKDYDLVSPEFLK